MNEPDWKKWRTFHTPVTDDRFMCSPQGALRMPNFLSRAHEQIRQLAVSLGMSASAGNPADASALKLIPFACSEFSTVRTAPCAASWRCQAYPGWAPSRLSAGHGTHRPICFHCRRLRVLSPRRHRHTNCRRPEPQKFGSHEDCGNESATTARPGTPPWAGPWS